MYDVFKARAYTNWMPHNFLFDGSRRMPAAGRRTSSATFPKPNPGDLEQRRPRLRAQGHRRLFRVAEEVAVVLPRRRQPGEDRGQQGRLVRPTARARATASSTPPFPVRVRDQQRGVRGRLHDEDDDVHGQLPGQQLQQRQPVDDVHQPVLHATPPTHTYLPPDNDYQRIALNGVCARCRMNSTLAAALHLGQDDQRRRCRSRC